MEENQSQKPRPICVIIFPYNSDLSKVESNKYIIQLMLEYNVLMVADNIETMKIEVINASSSKLISSILSKLISKLWKKIK